MWTPTRTVCHKQGTSGAKMARSLGQPRRQAKRMARPKQRKSLGDEGARQRKSPKKLGEKLAGKLVEKLVGKLARIPAQLMAKQKRRTASHPLMPRVRQKQPLQQTVQRQLRLPRLLKLQP